MRESTISFSNVEFLSPTAFSRSSMSTLIRQGTLRTLCCEVESGTVLLVVYDSDNEKITFRDMCRRNFVASLSVSKRLIRQFRRRDVDSFNIVACVKTRGLKIISPLTISFLANVDSHKIKRCFIDARCKLIQFKESSSMNPIAAADRRSTSMMFVDNVYYIIPEKLTGAFGVCGIICQKGKHSYRFCAISERSARADDLIYCGDVRCDEKYSRTISMFFTMVLIISF